MSIINEDQWMKMALREAERAYKDGEVPVGAVITLGTSVIAKAYNQVEQLKDPTAHAEILAITAACNSLGAKFLQDCTMYVTLEPCAMCAGALAHARIGQLVVGALDPKKGFSLIDEGLLHAKTLWKYGMLAEDSTEILQRFFQERRT